MVIPNQLIQDCVQKDRMAQKRLYGILLPYLNPVCQRYLVNSSDLQDTLQETFIRIFTNLNQFDSSRGQFKTWAVRIAINCSLKYNEKMYRLPVKELNGKHQQAVDPAALKKFSDEDLLTFLKQMPPSFFQVFNLHIIDGFSHKEIGQFLNIDESLSRKRLSRARKWLDERITKEKAKQLGLRKFI